MPHPDFTWPQHGDEPDAAHFAYHLGLSNLLDYVEDGLELQNVDYGGLTFDVAEGKAYILKSSMDTASSDIATQTFSIVGTVVGYAGGTGFTLTDGDVNYVYLDANFGTDDSPQIVVNTTGNAPTDESLLIGRIDTANDTTTPTNREPDGVFNDLRANDRQEPPTYATRSDVPTDMRAGGFVWVEDEQRYYYEDGN